MSLLLNPYSITNNIKLRNRLVMAPMTTWSARADGHVSDEELEYYGRRSVGVGMVITGTTYTLTNGVGFKGQFYAGDDAYLESITKLSETIKKGGAKAVLQIFHAGRMSRPGLREGNQVVAPSAVKALRDDASMPRPMTEGEIQETIRSFYDTTNRAIRAGFDGVEIHGANTYLLQQFFSPHSNRRDDKWGGDLERRMHFPMAVVDSVKSAIDDSGVKDFILGYRLSPEEIETPGIRLADTLLFVDRLADKELTYLNISLGEYKQISSVDEDDKTPIGKQILHQVNGRMPVLGVGSVNTKERAADALEFGYDAVLIGKSIIINPDWVERAEQGKAMRQSIKQSETRDLSIPQGLEEMLVNLEKYVLIKKEL